MPRLRFARGECDEPHSDMLVLKEDLITNWS